MGVDIQTYRARIGSYGGSRSSPNTEIINHTLHFTSLMKCIGAVAFIGLLLLVAGIESNPGPFLEDTVSAITQRFWRGRGNRQDSQNCSYPDAEAVSSGEVPAEAVSSGEVPGQSIVSDTVSALTQRFWRGRGNRQDSQNCSYPDAEAVSSGEVPAEAVSSGEVPGQSIVSDTVSALTQRFWHGRGNRQDSQNCSYPDAEAVSSREVPAEAVSSGEVPGQSIVSETRSHWEMFKRYNMEKWCPDKITLKEASTIVMDGEERNEGKPWTLLRNLMSLKSDARDSIVSGYCAEGQGSDLECVLTGIEKSEKRDDVCSLDIFIMVLLCSNPLLRQVLYKKLYFCKMAVPFLYLHNFTSKVLSVWPLRSLMIENFDKTEVSPKTEIEAINLKSHFILMARIGRPLFSKSKLLNTLLTDEGFSTFFNKDCPSGRNKRVICKGYVEAFWLPLSVAREKQFSGALTYLNARGDLANDFHNKDVTFFSKLVDVVTIVIDNDDILKHSEYLLRLTKLFKRVVLVFCNTVSLTDPVSNTLRYLKQLNDEKVEIITTYRNSVERNDFEMQQAVSNALKRQTSPYKRTMSLHDRMKGLIFVSDESQKINPDLFESKEVADRYFYKIKKETPTEWKEKLTPIQFGLSSHLAKNLKAKARQQNTESVKAEIRKIRKEQMKNITEYTRSFAELLVTTGKVSIHRLQLTLSWLGIFIDGVIGDILPKLLEENKKVWEILSQKRRNVSQKQNENEQERKFKECGIRFANVSFGVLHIFREVYHIYDTFIITKTDPAVEGMPSLEEMSSLFSKLIIEGFSVEIMNGDYTYVPMEWTEAVFKRVSKQLKEERVFVISVLGLQSSGKSTLLNTMFGSQFAVSAGRCTRGISTQLFQLKSCLHRSFKYILIVDTEGLRAPESGSEMFKHDNEMSTFSTGVGDITLLNIMGENTNEINDILQIMVHAFLRIKLANNYFKLTQSCVFLHQNVADAAADQKMKQGFMKLMNTLDNMTKEAASTENICDISAFSQVIKINDKSNVWYFPNLWQGIPPSARVSYSYSSKVLELRQYVLNKALNERNAAYKTLSDIAVKIRDLYEGILSENFVFSFRNSLEIKAHLALERGITGIKRNLEKDFIEAICVSSDMKFSKCDEEYQIDDSMEEIKAEIHRKVETLKTTSLQQLDMLFEASDYPEIIEDWKASKQRDVESFIDVMVDNANSDLRRLKEKREIVVKASTFYIKKEKEIFETSKRLASKIRNEGLQDSDIEIEFDKMWTAFMKGFPKQRRGISLREYFETSIWEMFKKDSHLLKKEVGRFDTKCSIKQLQGSSNFIEIEDLSTLGFFKHVPFTNKLNDRRFITVARNEIDTLFRQLDDIIFTLRKTKVQIQNFHIKTYLETIMDWSESMKKEKKRINLMFKPTCIIKLVYHASQFALEIFEKHNVEYQRKHGIEAELTQLKLNERNKLQALIERLNDEESASRIICVCVCEFIKQGLRQKLPSAVKEALWGLMPLPKHLLIVEIMESLMKGDSFDDFMDYIRSPYTFAKRWFSKKGMAVLFDSKSLKYREIAGLIVHGMFSDFTTALNESVNDYSEKGSAMDLDQWIKEYKACLEKKNIFLPKEIFSHSFLKKIELRCVENFVSLFRDKLTTEKKNLDELIDRETMFSIEWNGSDPIEKLFDQVWGCKEACVYCHEPCYKGTEHDAPERHSCIQHRPLMCIGVRNTDTQKCSISSCNSYVASDVTHTCGCFDDICKRSSGKCEIEVHPFKDYSTFVQNWAIEPCTDLELKNKYWMRFAVKFVEELKSRFVYDVSNIPESWHDVTDEDAIISIRQNYL